MPDKHIPPTYAAEDFHCPHCGVHAHQKWESVFSGTPPPPSMKGWPFPLGASAVDGLSISTCDHCKDYALWRDTLMIYPRNSGAPLPASDMPEDVTRDYMEARNIAGDSPRGAAALLRLALQKLMPHLGEKGKNLNEDTANLVKKGMTDRIQMALDSVRVIGNHAVHPGEIDLRDDLETATRLFELVNIIVEVMVTQPRHVAEVYAKVPKSARKAIEKRDKKS